MNIVVVTGYRSEELISYLDVSFPSINFTYIHNHRYSETNNIYSLALALTELNFEEDVLLIESDLVFQADVLSTLIQSTYDNVALVSPYATGMDGTVVQVEGNKIINIFPPHLQDENFTLFDKFKTLNIYKFKKEFVNGEFKRILLFYSSRVDDKCYYELILGILIYMQRQEIFCEIINRDLWAEVDDPNDLASANFIFSKSRKLDLLNYSFGGFWNYEILDFCFIRNMYFPTKSMLAELRNNLPILLQNYGSRQEILNEKLSYVLQCNVHNIIALNGAGQLFPILEDEFRALKFLLPNPTFGEYNRIFCPFKSYSDDKGFQIKEIEEKLRDSDAVVFVNPNNPTGSIIGSSWIMNLARQNPNKYFIVDESFIEFSDECSIIDYLEIHPSDNVIVLRSMSKSYGLPGVRLGFVYTTNEELLQKINTKIPIWNLNSVAEFYLEIILKNKRSLVESFERTKLARENFIIDLRELRFVEHVYESHADFVLIKTTEDVEQIGNFSQFLLNNYGIYVKNVSKRYSMVNNCYYRFAVRLQEENKLLIKSLADFQKKFFK